MIFAQKYSSCDFQVQTEISEFHLTPLHRTEAPLPFLKHSAITLLSFVLWKDENGGGAGDMFGDWWLVSLGHFLLHPIHYTTLHYTTLHYT